MADKPKHVTNFEKGKDDNGVFYRAMAVAIGSPDTGEGFGIIAPNVSILQDAWARLAKGPLDESRIQSVKIYRD